MPYIKKQGKGANNNLTFSNFVDYMSLLYKFGTSFYSKKFGDERKYYKTFNKRAVLEVQRELNGSKFLPKGSWYLNVHFAQYATLCHPCHIDFDYIVNFDTMREDAAYVLSKLGPHHQCLEDKYPYLFSRSQKSSSVFDSFFSTLSSQQIQMLKEMYSIDFKLFGYEDYRSNITVS